MLRRRRFLQSVAAIALLLPHSVNAGFAIFQINGSGGSGIPFWQPLLIGGGGFETGLSIAADNTLVARSDTPQAAFLFSTAKNTFIPLATSQTLPSANVSPRSDKLVGCWEFAICPNNSAKAYMVYANAVWLTTTLGLSTIWTQLTNFPTITDANANDGFRATHPKMAVDPQNDAICYVGTPSGGLQKTINSGTIWSTIAGVTASTVGGIAVVYDPTSGVVGGVKQGIFAFSQGVGVYHSTNGGTSWTFLNTTGMPTQYNGFYCDPNGKLWVCNNDANGLKFWTSGGGWVASTAISNSVHSIAVDPNNTNNIVVSQTQGLMYLSTNGGATFPINGGTNAATITTTGDAAWQALSNYTPPGGWGLTAGRVLFDSNSVLYFSWGYGVWKSTNPFADVSLLSITFQALSRGISTLDGNYIIHPPGASGPTGMAQDLPVWNNLSTTTFATKYGPDADFNGPQPTGGSHPGFTIDYATSDPTFLAALYATADGPGFSSNSGVNWSPFSNQTPFGNVFFGGSIACSSATNILVMCQSTSVYHTKNGGTSWTIPTYAGDQYNSVFTNSMLCCADRVTAGVFYIRSPNDGFYKSTDGADTFTRVSTFAGGSGNDGCVRFKSVPGQAGHAFYVPGFLDTGTPPDVNSQIFWTINGCTTFTQISGWDGEVMDVGFGTIVSGQSYPTLYVAGTRSGAFGVYMCQNFNPSTGAGSWTALGTNANGDHFPGGAFAQINGLAGHPSIDGWCSISLNNGGFMEFRS